MSGKTAAVVVSEVFGPAPLLVVAYLVVGSQSSSLLLAALVVACLAVVPYGLTVVLARRGRVSDRFVRDRRQRVPVLVGTLVFVLVGLAILLLAPGDNRPLVLLTCIVVVALVVVTVVSLKWKMSIHATIAAFVSGILVACIGWIMLPVAVAICVATCWARFFQAQHTVAQLIAGVGLGFVMASVYSISL